MPAPFVALALALVSSSSSAASEPARRASIFVLDFKAEPGLESASAAVGERVAEALARHEGLDVITRDDVVRLLELEAEKQLLSCDATSGSCLSELAGALGADLLAFGTVARVGDGLVANITLYDGRTSAALGRRSVSAADAQGLRRALPSAVHELATPVVGPPTSTLWQSPLFLGGVAASVVGLGVGVALGGVALTQDAILGDPEADRATKTDARAAGFIATGGAALGALALVGGAVAMGIAMAEDEQ